MRLLRMGKLSAGELPPVEFREQVRKYSHIHLKGWADGHGVCFHVS